MTNLMPLANGFQTTLTYFILTLALSIPLGIVIALLNQKLPKICQSVTYLYVYIFRGTPLLLQMMFIFFGLPAIGIVLNRENAAILTLILNYTAYFVEIFRGGINAIPKGQFEAIKVLSINKKEALTHIIMPQVFKIVMPSIGNEVINLVKDTSLIYVLGLEDLLKVGKSLANQQASLVPYIYVGIIYLVFTGVLTYILNKIEKQLNRSK